MYEIFEKLCKQHNVTSYRVCKETGLTTATISNWKAGRYRPKSDKLQKIADFFGVSLEYLLTGKEGVTENADEATEMNDVLEKYEELKVLLENGASHSIRFGGEEKSLSPESINLLIQQLDMSVAFIRELKNSDDKKEV